MVWVFRTSKWRRRSQAPQRVAAVPDQVFNEFRRLAQELAHEIRNPLTAINARLYKLQKTLPPGSSEHSEAALIADEIKRLDQILEEFRHRGGPAEPKPVPLSASLLMKEVRDLFGAQLDPQCIELRCEIREEIGFRGDPQLLKQVLINLVKNATESTLQAQGGLGESSCEVESHGTIVLRVRRQPARFVNGMADAVVLEVEDNGGGIPEEVRTRLLEPFFSTKEQGTGLGLPIAARIVAQHGGELEFESQPGHGAIFRVLLPLN